MENDPTQSIVEALEAEKRKREAFLDQMVSVIENTLSKVEYKPNDNGNA